MGEDDGCKWQVIDGLLNSPLLTYKAASGKTLQRYRTTMMNGDGDGDGEDGDLVLVVMLVAMLVLMLVVMMVVMMMMLVVVMVMVMDHLL